MPGVSLTWHLHTIHLQTEDYGPCMHLAFLFSFLSASWTTEGKKLDQKQLIVLKIEWVPM